jgi:hypothetical protein
LVASIMAFTSSGSSIILFLKTRHAPIFLANFRKYGPDQPNRLASSSGVVNSGRVMVPTISVYVGSKARVWCRRYLLVWS